MSSSANRRVPMSENHRRGITTALRFLDEMVCGFEVWARGRQVRSVLYEERNTLSEAQRRELLAEVAAVREALREVKERLGLEGEVLHASRDIWSRASAFREHLMELEGRALRRYGKVPPPLGRFMDALVARLLRRLDRIVAIVSGPTDAHRRPGG